MRGLMRINGISVRSVRIKIKTRGTETLTFALTKLKAKSVTTVKNVERVCVSALK